MKIYVLFSLLFLGLIFIVGCNPLPNYQEEVNQTVILAGIENGECVVNSINLWSSPNMESIITSIFGCSGEKVRVVSKQEVDGRKWYNIRLIYGDGNNSQELGGWVTDSFVQLNGVCTNNEDCKKIKDNNLFPICKEGVCVECLVNEDCSSREICKNYNNPSYNLCTECLTKEDCVIKGEGKNKCWIIDDVLPRKNECIECLRDTDCGDNKHCIFSTKTCQ